MNKIDHFVGEYRFLSNFWPSKIKLEGLEYPSVEHAFQAAKTTDLGAREAIRLAPTPGQAKRLGRKVSLRDDWDNVRLSIMESLLRQKFQDLSLRQKLLETGEATLIEGNSWGDVFWGVYVGVGKNHLGKLLMKVRGDLNENQSKVAEVPTQRELEAKCVEEAIGHE